MKQFISALFSFCLAASALGLLMNAAGHADRCRWATGTALAYTAAGFATAVGVATAAGFATAALSAAAMTAMGTDFENSFRRFLAQPDTQEVVAEEQKKELIQQYEA